MFAHNIWDALLWELGQHVALIAVALGVVGAVMLTAIVWLVARGRRRHGG